MSNPRPSPLGRPVPLLLAVVAAVLTLLHVTVWAGVLGPLRLGWVSVAALVPPYLAVLVTFAGRFYRLPLPRALVAGAYLWLGVLFLGFVATIAVGPVRWGLWLGGWPGLLPVVAAATGLGVLAVAVSGWVEARRDPAILRIRVPIDGLDPALAGLRVAQISDVHVGHTTRAFLEGVVDAVNGLEPDLIAITGDLVEGTVDEIADDLVSLTRLRARHGVFFVTGNHEYYVDGPRWAAHLPSLGIRVLRNERVRLDHDGAALDVVGVDDPFGVMAPEHGTDLPRALEGRDPAVPSLLLAHQPVTVAEAAGHGITLQLSGHTHGGQIWPFHWLVRLAQPYLAGLVRHGDTWLYVHRGTGHWGPPLRVGARSEIALLELQTAGP